MAGPSFEEMLKQTHEMREHVKQMQGSAQHMSESFGSAFRSFVGANAVVHLFEPVFKSIRGYADNLLRLTTQTTAQVDAEYIARVRAIRELRLSGDITRAEAQRRQDALRAERPLYTARGAAGDAFAASSRLAMGYLAVAAASTAKLVHDFAALNRSLVASNSGFGERNKLVRTNLDVMIRTGQSFDDILQAQQALVEYGGKQQAGMAQTVETVVMLHKGLGVSVQSAASLAVVVENQVRGSFQSVSDVLANVVNQTSLVGEEAARMAKELTGLLSLIRGQSGGNLLPEMTKAVARYEDALKRISGTTGAVTELIKRAASPEGFGMAGSLGVYSPDMLATQQGIDTLMQNFRRLGDSLVGESQGWQRRMGLDALAKMMGMSAEEVNNLYMSVKNTNQGITDEVDLRERYRQQSRDLAATLSQLGNRLVGLMERGMYPLLIGINYLATGVSKLVDWISRSEAIVTALTTMAIVAVPLAIIALSSLIRSLYQLAAASLAARLGTGGGLIGTLFTGLRAGLAAIWTPMGVLLGGILAAVGIGAYWARQIYDINKETQNKAREGDWRHTAGLMDLAQRQRELITFNARYGRFQGLDTKILSYLSDVGGALAKEGLTGEAYASRLRQAAKDLRSDVDRAAYTSTQFSGSTLTPQQQAVLDQQMNVEEAVTKSGEVMAKTYKDVGNRNLTMMREHQQEMNLKWYQEIGVDAVDWLARHSAGLITPISK